jgi:hypothetical protein
MKCQHEEHKEEDIEEKHEEHICHHEEEQQNGENKIEIQGTFLEETIEIIKEKEIEKKVEPRNNFRRFLKKGNSLKW